MTLPLAGSNYGFLYHASRADALRQIADAGYELVELSACPPHLDLSDVGPEERRTIAAELERHGLRCVSANPVELNPISENAQLKAATAHQYRMAIELCGELGGHSVVMITGRRSPLIPISETRARELLRAHLEALLPLAGGLGVTIALEPVPYGFLQTASEVAGFIRESGLEGVGIAADCANLLVADVDPAEEVRANADLVAIAHVSDSWRGRWAHTQVGRAEIDFEAFAGALAESAYAGATVYELVDGEDPGPRLRGDGDTLRGWGVDVTDAPAAAGPRQAAIGPLRPFRVEVPQRQLDDLARRLGAARETGLPFAAPELGVDPGQLRRLVAHWRERFDWRGVEAELNRHAHVLVEVDGMDVHAVHARGDGPDPMPLVINHGWPSSFAEFLPIVDLLTRPGDHGGDPADAFDVVLPSLSGYVFSAPPLELADSTASRMAERFHGLMTALGYERYGACGSDVGARVSAWLGAVAPDAVIGLHVTSNAISPAPATNDEERAWLARQDEWWESEGAYGHIQRTKPGTLAVAMNDSPVGLAAWILEKWTDWGDTGGDAIGHFGADHLLRTIALHWFAGSIGTSFLTYAAAVLPPGPRPPAGAVTAPAGFYVAEAEPHGYAPRGFAERQYRVARWSKMPRGGHFLASEDPERYVEDMREFFRPLRGGSAA